MRATAFPSTQSVDALSEKLNLNNLTTFGRRLLIDMRPLGIVSSLQLQLEPGKDYTRRLALAALLKTPMINESRYTIFVYLRDAVPHGHIWLTDAGNVRTLTSTGTWSAASSLRSALGDWVFHHDLLGLMT